MPREFAYRFVDSEKEATSYQGPSFSSTLPPIPLSSRVDRKVLGDDIPSSWAELCDLIVELCHDANVPAIFFYTRVAYEWLKITGGEKNMEKRDYLAFDEYERTMINVITPITSKDNPKKENSNMVQKKESGIIFHCGSDSFGWSALPALKEGDLTDSLNYQTLGLLCGNRVFEKHFSIGGLLHLIRNGADALHNDDPQSVILSLHVLAHLYLAFPPREGTVVVLYYD